VDSPGDNLLAELTSVVDAVQCSVAPQNKLKARNAKLPSGYEYIGEQTAKNIAKPAEAYTVFMKPKVTKKNVAGLKQGAGEGCR
jgi:hypothetical protein